MTDGSCVALTATIIAIRYEPVCVLAPMEDLEMNLQDIRIEPVSFPNKSNQEGNTDSLNAPKTSHVSAESRSIRLCELIDILQVTPDDYPTKWHAIIEGVRNQLHTNPPPAGPVEFGYPSDPAITISLAVLASMEYKGHDKRAQRCGLALRGFSWLNRINLLRYQHELNEMEHKFRENTLSLLDAGELDRMREMVEKYSISPPISSVNLFDELSRA